MQERSGDQSVISALVEERNRLVLQLVKREGDFERFAIPSHIKGVEFDCFIVREGKFGSLSGYVGVPKWHPLFGKSHLEELCGHRNCERHTLETLIDVHCGITRSGNDMESQMNKNLWYFGFDCRHSCDLTPSQINPVSSQSPGLTSSYRDIEYVKAECIKLATQLEADGTIALLLHARG